jgi:hypothetical protein
MSASFIQMYLTRTFLNSPLRRSEEESDTINHWMKSWSFNPLESSDETLLKFVWVSYKSLIHSSYLSSNKRTTHRNLEISVQDLQSFILTVNANYLENSYHNFKHAVDVLQFSVYLYKISPTLNEIFRPLDIFAMLVATYCHDMGHTGCNNAYMINSQSSVAILYNDKSVLENLHCTMTFAIMKRFPFAKVLDQSSFKGTPEQSPFIKNSVIRL